MPGLLALLDQHSRLEAIDGWHLHIHQNHGEILIQDAFQRFFDSLEPAFSHMISLGQSNTIVSCPALTTHSELSDIALAQGGMTPSMVRLAVGDEDPYDLINHIQAASRLAIDPSVPGFSDAFPPRSEIEQMVEECYVEFQRRYIQSRARPPQNP